MYERLLDSDVIQWILKTYPKVDFVFQQDRTPANNASSIQYNETEELRGEANCWHDEIIAVFTTAIWYTFGAHLVQIRSN